MLVFTEFGRRMRDNGSGTDHGSGGGAFIIGDRVNGGLYSEYPALDPAQWLYGEDSTGQSTTAASTRPSSTSGSVSTRCRSSTASSSRSTRSTSSLKLHIEESAQRLFWIPAFAGMTVGRCATMDSRRAQYELARC